MRYLLFSSCLVWCMFHSSLQAQHSNEIISNSYRLTIQDAKYKASIDVLDKHISGILVVKVQEDSSIRTVFVNEMGVTFFDISFYDYSYIFHSIMESMNKKAVKITLAKDLGMILMRGIFKTNNYKNFPNSESIDKLHFIFKLKRKGTVHYFAQNYLPKFETIENKGKRKTVVSISQKYLPNYSMPDSIFVQHQTVHFTIALKQLYVIK